MTDFDEIDRQIARGSAARLGLDLKDAPPPSRAFTVLFWIVLTALVIAAIRWFSP